MKKNGMWKTLEDGRELQQRMAGRVIAHSLLASANPEAKKTAAKGKRGEGRGCQKASVGTEIQQIGEVAMMETRMTMLRTCVAGARGPDAPGRTMVLNGVTRRGKKTRRRHKANEAPVKARRGRSPKWQRSKPEEADPQRASGTAQTH